MRKINTHEQNPCNRHLHINVLDEPGAGGACHNYFIGGFHTKSNTSANSGHDDETSLNILFQNGPIPEMGVNGITQEALLAIVLDRLYGFQSSEFKCRENALAITKIEEAMHWLHHRTHQREMRGVEGTHTV